MNLKEAFRYQNKLGSLMEEAQSILGLEGNITRIENTYLRKKVFDGAENETVIDTPPTEFADRITDIVRFLMALMEQEVQVIQPAPCMAEERGKGIQPVILANLLGNEMPEVVVQTEI